MTAQQMPFQLPDFELRDLVLKTLREHPRPHFHTNGVKVLCKCGWTIPKEAGKSNSNQLLFHRHQAFAIEYAITALLNEQDEAA